MNLNGIKMNVIETAENGVVNAQTIFSFTQMGDFVSAIYSGGKILQGNLVGKLIQDKLFFSYCQLQTNGEMSNGQSECDISIGEDKKIRLIERFIKWGSGNDSKGVNIFQEL